MHEHFDVEGNLTGRTVVTRESMWDDESRGRALRLMEYEAGLCPCGCGLRADVVNSPNPMRVEKFTCYASRALAAKKRADQDEHEKDPKVPARDSAGNPVARWDDGLNYYVVPQD